jgi:mannosyltransferase OCH1-like enzyme/GT2 family glycosyltransferase
MIFKIIHKEWIDNIELNVNNNRLKRRNEENEYGDYEIIQNILMIKWDNWDKEYFSKNDNNEDIYYYCEKKEFIDENWKEYCYIDNFNNIIYRSNDFKKGYFKIKNDEIEVLWEEEKMVDNDTNSKIPKIIHFVYGLKEQKEEFELYRYLAVASAFKVNKPDKIYFYYYYEPYGYWWEKTKEIVTLERIEPPTEIYGNELYHYAHKADIIRLQKLIEYGGIYLDIDTICLNSFDNLLDYDFVMGTQTNLGETETYGLCNAVMLSKPNSVFANKWLESYSTFKSKGRDEYWDEHSVIIPLELSREYSKYIKILNSKSFFYPLWYDINTILFDEKISIEEYKKIIKNNYCIHLWDTYSHSYLKTLTEEKILNQNTLYNIFARKFLKNKISVVFLTYNRLEITERCLNSYLKCLNNENIEELIVLDNNSNIETIKYLKDFQEKNDKIKLIFSSENLGVCKGRNVLFGEVKGDIIISLDSDAYLLNNNFFNKVEDLLYNEKYGIVGIAGAFIKGWEFGSQEDIDEKNQSEFEVDHIAGCCQAFRKDLFLFGLKLDLYYDKFWVEDTDFCMQSLELNKKNFRINQSLYIDHHWGGSGSNFPGLFEKNWNYFVKKWKGNVLHYIK